MIAIVSDKPVLAPYTVLVTTVRLQVELSVASVDVLRAPRCIYWGQVLLSLIIDPPMSDVSIIHQFNELICFLRAGVPAWPASDSDYRHFFTLPRIEIDFLLYLAEKNVLFYVTKGSDENYRIDLAQCVNCSDSSPAYVKHFYVPQKLYGTLSLKYKQRPLQFLPVSSYVHLFPSIVALKLNCIVLSIVRPICIVTKDECTDWAMAAKAEL